MAFRAAVVGLGNMGSAFDGGELARLPRTHVGALLANSDFQLAAACDPIPARRATFFRDWRSPCKALESVDALAAEGRLDLLVVASSTSTHFEVLQRALHLPLPPRHIFCEKPFCDRYERAQIVATDARAAGVTLSVNYHRRWDAKMLRLREHVARLAPPEYAQVVYRKGLYNYGSHLVNLLQFFFGETTEVMPLGPPGSESPSADLGFRSGLRARVTGIEGANYELCDAEFFFRDAKLSLEFGGQIVREYRPQDDVFFPRYRSLVEVKDAYPPGPVHGLTAAYQEIARILRGELEASSCTALEALATLRVLERMAGTAK